MEPLDRDEDAEDDKEQSKREKPVVRPEEIPPVPENRFLLRRDMPSQEDATEMSVQIGQTALESVSQSLMRRC